VLGVIERSKKPSQFELERERWIVKFVKEQFGVADDGGRALPWKSELDGSMFYL
jgi:hypothetical protein